MRQLLGALLIIVGALAGCSAVPNLDAGSAGCQNAEGIGPAGSELANGGTDMKAAPALHGKLPAAAAAAARAAGHTVVFNTDGQCWCDPPPDGTVTESWWGEKGALWLWVDGATIPSGEPPFLGWGCELTT